jgi:methyl acetate hydrolase
MAPITRRRFARVAAALSAAGRTHVHAAPTDAPLTAALSASLMRHGIPAAALMVASGNATLHHFEFGSRDSASGQPITSRSIFAIASMTKPITAVAAMQLVERGKLKLDDPVAKYLPELENLEVLAGFAADGHPILRPAAGAILVRHLLTHTSGFAYDVWDAEQLRYTHYLKETKTPDPRVPPLSFDPGTEWRYGSGLDWAGRLVEKISGKTLEAWFQEEIFQPLGMDDTSFVLPPEKFDRQVGRYRREDGQLKEQPRTQPEPPKSFNGGGGLFSTTQDYVKFMQMILRRGAGERNARTLRAETVDLMTRNQVGAMSAGKLKSVGPASRDIDMHPGHKDGFGYGFLINLEDYDSGRSAGSLAWAGFFNTFFWIDPRRQTCAVILMQLLPFCDEQAVGVLRDFERATYSILDPV